MLSAWKYVNVPVVCRWYWHDYAPQVRTVQQLTENRIAQLGSAPHLVVAQAVCDMLGNTSVEQTSAELNISAPQSTFCQPLPTGNRSTPARQGHNSATPVPLPPLPPPDRNAYIQRHGMFLACGESSVTGHRSPITDHHALGLYCPRLQRSPITDQHALGLLLSWKD